MAHGLPCEQLGRTSGTSSRLQTRPRTEMRAGWTSAVDTPGLHSVSPSLPPEQSGPVLILTQGGTCPSQPAPACSLRNSLVCTLGSSDCHRKYHRAGHICGALTKMPKSDSQQERLTGARGVRGSVHTGPTPLLWAKVAACHGRRARGGALLL